MYCIAGKFDGGLNLTIDDAHVKLNPLILILIHYYR